MSLRIAASDISQGQNWCCLFKKVQYRLCHCVLLHLIYHKDKTGVVYSKRCNIDYVIAYCCIWYITRTKLMLSIQKGAISTMSLRFAASDISQGQNWCCLFKKVQYRLCHCVLPHQIYHKDKTGVVYSKKVQYRPMPLHIAASAISQGQNWCCVFQKVQYCPMPLHIAASAISQGENWCCVFKTVQYRL